MSACMQAGLGLYIMTVFVHHGMLSKEPCWAGTKRVKYLEENMGALDVRLTKQDMARVEAVFHGKVGQPLMASANFFCVEFNVTPNLVGSACMASSSTVSEPGSSRHRHGHVLETLCILGQAHAQYAFFAGAWWPGDTGATGQHIRGRSMTGALQNSCSG